MNSSKDMHDRDNDVLNNVDLILRKRIAHSFRMVHPNTLQEFYHREMLDFSQLNVSYYCKLSEIGEPRLSRFGRGLYGMLISECVISIEGNSMLY
jgi:hypothetical protein